MRVVSYTILIFILTAFCAGAQEPAVVEPVVTPFVGPHFYGIERGSVQYKIEGGVTGTETLYFDQWGMRQARYRTATSERIGTSTIITLSLQETVMTIDPDKNLGRKLIDEDLKNVLANPPTDPAVLLSTETLRILGAESHRTETFLDRECQVWETKKNAAQVWVWKGIPLKTVMETRDGQVSYSAIKIEEGIAIDEKLFAVPEKVRFIDMDIEQILISLRGAREDVCENKG